MKSLSHLSDATRYQRAGILFLASGCAFVAASLLAQQPAFLGVSAAMFGLGGAFFIRARRTPNSN